MTNKSTVTVLQEMVDYFSDQKRWTQYALAKDSGGITCHPRDPDAQCHCLDGGIVKFDPDFSKFPVVPATDDMSLVYRAINYNKTANLIAEEIRSFEFVGDRYAKTARTSEILYDFNDVLASHEDIVAVLEAALAKAKALHGEEHESV